MDWGDYDTVLYSKTNFYKSQPPQLPQQFGGGAISQTGLPQNSISTSPSPITMTPCYILKQTFTKVNLLNYPNNLRGVLSRKPDYHKTPSPLPPPHYNDTVLYSKTSFYKSQPPRLPQQFEGGAISQTGLPQNSISTSPSTITMTPCYILKRAFTKVNLLDYPNNLRGVLSRKPDYHKTPSPLPLHHYNDTVLYSKTNFYKSQPHQLPQQFGGVLSRKPDYHKTPSPLPPPPLQWHRAIF